MGIDEIVEKRKEAYKDIIKKYPIDGASIHKDETNPFIDLFNAGFVTILLCQNEDVVDNIEALAKSFEKAGGSCVAAYTEPNYYNGSVDSLLKLRKNIMIPIIRKDFIFDEYQIYESKMIGADAIELIPSIISFDLLRYFIKLCSRIGLGVIVSCKNEEEFNKAYQAGATVFGIKQKALGDYAIRFRDNLIKEGKTIYLIMSNERELRSVKNIIAFMNSNYDGMVIGKYFMKSKNPDKVLKQLFDENKGHS